MSKVDFLSNAEMTATVTVCTTN